MIDYPTYLLQVLIMSIEKRKCINLKKLRQQIENNSKDDTLEIFSRHYFSSTIPGDEIINKIVELLKINNTIIDDIIGHQLLYSYPPKRSFEKFLLKKIINKLEKEGHHCSDKIYEKISLSMIGNEKYYRIYFDTNFINYILIQENDKQLTSGTTGLSSWQAASILASYILYDVEFNLKHNFRDKKILEIGSGCGLTGIAIKIFNNPSFINLTDGNEIVLKQLEYNVQVNDLSFESDNIAVSYLNWEEEYRDDIIYDYIIAADVVYDPSILSSLLKTISKLLQSNTSAVFIIASTLRNPETIEAFENQIDSNNLLLLEKKVLTNYENIYFPFSTTISTPTIIHLLQKSI